ncbi:MAG: MarR family transcriptional regulator [Myxococcales bacterium]|nr:MarR family transcriptional regulator [Myxococcales bacterium]
MPDLCRLFQVLDLARDAQQAVGQVLEPFGLTQATFGVMYTLKQGASSNKDLAEEAGCAPSNITRLVDRLVEQGLVERIPAEDDRRRQVTRLTVEGHARWEAAATALQATQSDLIGRVQGVLG